MKFRSSVLLAMRFIFSRNSGAVSNARRSLLGALICIGLSLIPLIVVLVVTNGMIDGLTKRIIGLSTYDMQVVYNPKYYRYPITLEEIQDIAHNVSKEYGVNETFVERQGVGLALGKLSRSGITIRAVEQDIFDRNSAFSSLFSLVSGSFDLSNPRSVLIGSKLSELLGVSVGDTIRLITVRENQASAGVIPRLTSVTITGIVSSGYQELDALWVFMPLSTGFSILSPTSSKLLVGIETVDPFSSVLNMQARSIAHSLPLGYSLYTWQELNKTQYQNYESTRNLLLFIMMLIVLVACTNVSSALVMLVMEHRKEIAILKSFGATPAGITIAFVIAGTCIGIGGVLVGLPLGLLFAVNVNQIIHFTEKFINFLYQCMYTLKGITNNSLQEIRLLDPAYYLQEIPIVIPFFDVLVIVTGTIVLSAIVSFIPAIRSGNEKPLHILRKF